MLRNELWLWSARLMLRGLSVLVGNIGDITKTAERVQGRGLDPGRAGVCPPMFVYAECVAAGQAAGGGGMSARFRTWSHPRGYARTFPGGCANAETEL